MIKKYKSISLEINFGIVLVKYNNKDNIIKPAIVLGISNIQFS